MNDTLEYKDFTGSVYFSTEEERFFGRIKGISDLVTFEGPTMEKVEDAFNKAVDEYVKFYL